MMLSTIVYCALIVVLGIIKKDEVLSDIKKMTGQDATILVLLTVFAAFSQILFITIF